MPDFSSWVGMISQAVMSLASGPSSRSRNLESEAIVKRARRLGAQEFQGNLDPSVADDWFQVMEEVFEVIQCSDEQKLSIATFMLGGKARDWWRAIKTRQSRGVKLTWKDFKKEFFQQYYPKVYINEKRTEFLRLHQGRMTVGEYESTFTSLSRFATKFVDDEEEKCRLFLEGLNLLIRSKVGMHTYNSYNELVQGAMKDEGYERQYINRRQERGRRGAPQMSFGSPGKQQNQGTQ